LYAGFYISGLVLFLTQTIYKFVDAPFFHMDQMNTPIDYRDADDFQNFWDQDAQRSIEAICRIGKVQYPPGGAGMGLRKNLLGDMEEKKRIELYIQTPPSSRYRIIRCSLSLV
jgi:hypothetical protein